MLVRVTLREIAAAAGVHYSTVSLALRDHPRISLPIRNRIKKLALKMGYTPDPALSALNAYRKTKLQAHYQATLAWINNWDSPENPRNIGTFNDYFQGAANRARQLGYKLEEFPLREINSSADRASNILQSRGIKGLLFAPQRTPETAPLINFDCFSSVAFGYTLRPHIFHLITNHHSHSMIRALQEVEALGYQRIGLFMSETMDNKVDNAYTTSFWGYFNKRPKLLRLKTCIVQAKENDQSIFAKWLKKVSPDVIISNGCPKIVDWLKDLKLKIPRDIGYVALSVPREETYCSGIYENGLLIGKVSVDILVDMLQRGEYGPPEAPIRTLVEGQWISGKTLRKQRP